MYVCIVFTPTIDDTYISCYNHIKLMFSSYCNVYSDKQYINHKYNRV